MLPTGIVTVVHSFSVTRAKGYFEQVRKSLPDDPATLCGPGQCLFELQDFAGADAMLIRVLELFPTGRLGEIAGEFRSKNAAATFRAAGVPRIDAIMFCLETLRFFSDQTKKETQQIVLEIALLGQRGLDINNYETKYRLRTLPGQFSGLQQLAYLYVGFKVLDPNMAPDFDLSKKYEVARGMFNRPPKGVRLLSQGQVVGPNHWLV